MAWPPTRASLERARDELERHAAERPKARVLEPLARTHRWLGEDEEASRRFREAAEDVRAVLERHGREDGPRLSQVGSLLVRAGDAASARPWLERALRSERGAGRLAALYYLLGSHDEAVTTARRAAEDPDDRPYPWAEAIEALAIARRDGDGDRATRARETFASLIRSDRTPPWEESGSANLSLFDWYEEAASAEAGLHGEPVPHHAELLARLER